MKGTRVAIALFLGCLFIMACGSRPQATIMDLLIHFEKSGIDVDTNPITPQEKEAFKRTIEKLRALKKKYPRLARKAKKVKRPYLEMKVVALDGLRVMIYRYKDKDKARQAYEELLAKEKAEGEQNKRRPFPRLKYTYLYHGVFLIKIPHWKPRVKKGRISLIPPSVTEVKPDPHTVEKIKRALETFQS